VSIFLSVWPKELKSTNEALRALQLQLEKAYQSNLQSTILNPPNSTLTAILETKDARIATLEKEVALLEQELDRIRECGLFGISPPALDFMDLPKTDYKRQVSQLK